MPWRMGAPRGEISSHYPLPMRPSVSSRSRVGAEAPESGIAGMKSNGLSPVEFYACEVLPRVSAEMIYGDVEFRAAAVRALRGQSLEHP